MSETVIVLFMPICVMPLLDRTDIHVEVPRVDYDKLTSERLGGPSEAIRARVERAREIQRRRFAGTLLTCNADMGPAEVREICKLDGTGRGLVRAAMQQLQMSARAFHHILKLARKLRTWPEVSASKRRTWPKQSSTGRGEHRKPEGLPKPFGFTFSVIGRGTIARWPHA